MHFFMVVERDEAVRSRRWTISETAGAEKPRNSARRAETTRPFSSASV